MLQAAGGERGQVVIAHTEEDLQGRHSVVYPVRPDLDSRSGAVSMSSVITVDS